ncbi:MAG: ATP-binding protein [Gammaproteobacteria bacterium]|jgi:signal transduction histidine kinase
MNVQSLKHYLVPNTLFGRLVLVLLGGLLIAQLLGAYILLRDRATSLYETSGWYIAQRFASIVELMDTLPATQRQLILTSLNTPTVRIGLENSPRLSTSSADPHATQLHAVLSRQLNQRPLHVAILDWDDTSPTSIPGMPGMMRGMHGMRHGPAHQMMMASGPAAFHVEAQLTDGAWVSMVQGLPEDHFLVPDKLVSALAVLLVSVVILSLWAVRRVTRPLTQLGEAAETLGRDITRPPLDETIGPRDVQYAAHAFNTMQTRIANYIKDRERFLAAVSHDLKTPITRMRLRAELLEDEAAREKFLHDLNDMETMTVATLDFIRGEQQREPTQPVDIMALLESLQEDRQAMGQQVILNGTAKPYPAQPMALRRTLENLIDNAIKYGEQANVTIEDTDQQLVIRIADQGLGIPEQQLTEVFEPFHRLEQSRNRETGGVGLGLTIARTIARAHGGDLTLRNHPDGGLEATLDLPR